MNNNLDNNMNNNMNNNVNSNLDNTLNITPDVNIMNSLSNNQQVNSNIQSFSAGVQNNNLQSSSTVMSNNNAMSSNTISANNNTQPVNVAVPSNNAMPVNNDIPNQNIPSSNNGSNEGKNNTALLIIFGVIIFLIVAVLGFILIYKLFISNHISTVKRTTEYEITRDNNTTMTTTKKTNTSDTFEYNGFVFTKEPGYIYGTYVNGNKEFLKISSLDVVILIFPLNVNFSNFKETDLTSQLTNSTMTASNRKISTYKGIEMTTYEVTYNSTNEKLLAAYSSYPNNNFTLSITIENSKGEIDYDDINKVATMLNNSSFDGDSTSFSKDIVIK